MTRVAITHVASRGPYLAGAAPAEEPLASPRARKMMSRGAYLAASALADLLQRMGLSPAERAELGYFLGVGGSAGSLEDVTVLLDASIVDDQFSLPRFGDRGLAACNPLLAFQLMNNFTMCHGAILEGLSGPNGAMFSRGAGTIAALAEAHHAVRSGECPRAIAGGADVATHPVTLAELARDGYLSRGLVPADGAALFALGPSTAPDEVLLDGCAHASGRGRSVTESIDDALARATKISPSWPAAVDLVVLVRWGVAVAEALRGYAEARFSGAQIVDASSAGETLAASAAFAVLTAAHRLRARMEPSRAVVLSLGIDGESGAVLLSRGGAT